MRKITVLTFLLIQTLLANDLVDELWLKIFLMTAGSGKRLFEKGALPVACALEEVQASPSGVLIAPYKWGEEFKTGTVGSKRGRGFSSGY